MTIRAWLKILRSKRPAIQVDITGICCVHHQPHGGAGQTIEGRQEIVERHAIAMHLLGRKSDRQIAYPDLRESRVLDHPVAGSPARAL